MAASNLVRPLNPYRSFNCEVRLTGLSGQAPIMQHETFQHYTSTRSAFVEWYKESKVIRMGYATGTVGSDPSEFGAGSFPLVRYAHYWMGR